MNIRENRHHTLPHIRRHIAHIDIEKNNNTAIVLTHSDSAGDAWHDGIFNRIYTRAEQLKCASDREGEYTIAVYLGIYNVSVA